MIDAIEMDSERASAPSTEQTRCLSVVMPCYNEAATIERVALNVLASPLTAELIIVDDGSTDETLAIARSLQDERVRVIAQRPNQGKGAALRRGFAEFSFPYVIVQDADLEYDPKEFDRILSPILEGRADVVYGSRFLGDRPHRVLYYWHAVGNRVLTTASNMFTNLNLSDMETCYKAFRREVIQSFVIEEDRFGFEPEITAKVAEGGWCIYEVGISYAGRTYEDGKKVGWRDGFRAMYCIVRYSPLRQRIVQRLKDRHLALPDLLPTTTSEVRSPASDGPAVRTDSGGGPMAASDGAGRSTGAASKGPATTSASNGGPAATNSGTDRTTTGLAAPG